MIKLLIKQTSDTSCAFGLAYNKIITCSFNQVRFKNSSIQNTMKSGNTKKNTIGEQKLTVGKAQLGTQLILTDDQLYKIKLLDARKKLVDTYYKCYNRYGSGPSEGLCKVSQQQVHYDYPDLKKLAVIHQHQYLLLKKISEPIPPALAASIRRLSRVGLSRTIIIKITLFVSNIIGDSWRKSVPKLPYASQLSVDPSKKRLDLAAIFRFPSPTMKPTGINYYDFEDLAYFTLLDTNYKYVKPPKVESPEEVVNTEEGIVTKKPIDKPKTRGRKKPKQIEEPKEEEDNTPAEIPAEKELNPTIPLSARKHKNPPSMFTISEEAERKMAWLFNIHEVFDPYDKEPTPSGKRPPNTIIQFKVTDESYMRMDPKGAPAIANPGEDGPYYGTTVEPDGDDFFDIWFDEAFNDRYTRDDD